MDFLQITMFADYYSLSVDLAVVSDLNTIYCEAATDLPEGDIYAVRGPSYVYCSSRLIYGFLCLNIATLDRSRSADYASINEVLL